MTYVSKPMGNRLGIFAPHVEKLRQQRRLDEKGFPAPRATDESTETDIEEQDDDR